MSEIGALLFGAVIIVFFSYERFNRVSYEGNGRLERLVYLLSPDKLRARRIVLRAYFVYVATQLMLYLFFCAYAEVLPLIGGPVLGGGDIGASELPTVATEAAATAATGYSPDSDLISWNQPLGAVEEPSPGWTLGIAPEVSLAVALIMVGLAPSFPILQRFEAWMRDATHRLAGIPTHVIGAAEDLRRRTLDIGLKKSGTGRAADPRPALLPRGDLERLKVYMEAEGGKLRAPLDFRNDLIIIFAVSDWVLSRGLKLSHLEVRHRFEPLERELAERAESLILALDERSGFHRSGPPQPVVQEPAEEAPEDVRQGANWERLAGDAEKLADDMCLLLALYNEHGIIDLEAEDIPDTDSATETVRKHGLALESLRKFFQSGNGDAVPHVPASNTLPAWIWSTAAVLAVTFLWYSLGPGRLEVGLVGYSGSFFLRSLSELISAFNIFAIPMIVSLGIRDGGLHTHRWNYMSRLHWTQWLPQAALVLSASWVVATVIIGGLVLWSPRTVGSWNFEELLAVFAFNGPIVLRGAILSLIVICVLDSPVARRPDRHRASRWRSLVWALRAAVLMGLVGALTRILNTKVAASSARPPRLWPDGIDYGLIVYATGYSALIGFVVVFCVAEAVQNPQRRFGARTTPGGESKSGTGQRRAKEAAAE